jgi:membrane protein implicated in regulation of membrane protease activity
MPDTHPTAAGPPAVTLRRVLAGLCLATPFVALLWVGSYARLTPGLIGVPFFYWYQLAWVPLSAALTYTAYALVRAEERARAGRGAGPGPDHGAGRGTGMGAGMGAGGDR